MGINIKTKDSFLNEEQETIGVLIQELNQIRYENVILKENVVKITNFLYELIDGVENLNTCHSSEDYFVAVELLITPELEAWHKEYKIKFEEERLRLLRVNALSKLSDEEKKALGL